MKFRTTSLTPSVVVLLVTGVAMSWTPSAAGGTGSPDHKVVNATFGAAPASAKGVDGRPYFVYDTTPGGINRDHLAVLNISHKPERLSIYTVDAVPGSNGVISFPGRNVKPVQAGAWMSVGTPGVITVKPRSTVILPVHVHVPTNAPPGDHVGAVIVSLTGEAKAKFGKGGAQRVKFEQRIAVRSEFRVTGPLHPNLTIQNLDAAFSGALDPFAKGEATVTYEVHNDGNVVLGGPQAVTIHGLFGEDVAAKRLVDLPPLLPGATYGPVIVRVKGIYPEVGMKATVTVHPAGLQGQVTPNVPVVSASVHFLAIPWVILIALLLVLLWLLLLFLRRRRRKRLNVAPTGRRRLEPTAQGAD